VKFKSLEDKLELYYNQLNNPKRLIGNWVIVDTNAHDSLKKITITNINDINNTLLERLVLTETKNKYISIKYSLNFIAIKIIDTEYDCLLKDWDLIAVDKEYLYKGSIGKTMTNKELLALLGFKLSKKAKLDLESFN